MYKFIKYYDIGYKDGMGMALKDSLSSIDRKFKIIKIKELKSQLYDLGYIDGYNIIKKLTFNIDKNIV